MKKGNIYRQFRRRMFLQAALMVALGEMVSYGLLLFLTEGVFRAYFSRMILRILMRTGSDYEGAQRWYTGTFVENRGPILLVLLCFFLILAIAHVICVSSKKLKQLGDELEDILQESRNDSSSEDLMQPSGEIDLEEQLEELRKRLQRREKEAAISEQKKNELVVYLAHDLKTPLTSVIAYLTMLKEHPDMESEEQKKYIRITLEKALRLGELIQEFFEITRFNVQGILLDKKEFDLSILLEQLADESYGMLNKKQITCEVDVEEDLRIEADPDKLARVFDNLLRNAANYSYERTQLLIQARKSGNRVTILFVNTGPQIPQKKLEMIFEKFYRADDSRSSSTGGAGLGLAIAKQIVELHGGVITATSDPAHTRFIVTLPLHPETGTNGKSSRIPRRNRKNRK